MIKSDLLNELVSLYNKSPNNSMRDKYAHLIRLLNIKPTPNYISYKIRKSKDVNEFIYLISLYEAKKEKGFY